MKLGRTSSLLVFTVTLLGLLLMIWAVSLIRDAFQYQAAGETNARLIGRLIEFEDALHRLEAIIHQEFPDDSPKTATQYWVREYAEYLKSREEISGLYPPETVLSMLAETDSVTHNMDSLYMEVISLPAASKPLQEIAFYQESHRAVSLVREEIRERRAYNSQLSQQLTRNWHILSMLMVVCFLMLIMFAAIMRLYQQDLRKRKRIEKALKRITAEFRAIFKSIPDAVVFSDMNHEILMVNPAFTDLFGYNPEEIVGQQVEVLFARKNPQNDPQSPPENGHLVPFEANCLRKNQQAFVSETVEAVVRDEGMALGYFSIIRDITKRKRAEQALSAAHDKLEMWVNERTEDLMRANEEVKRFAYIVSHDLRAPLVNVKGFAGELRHSFEVINNYLRKVLPHLSDEEGTELQEILSEEIPEALQFIDASASRMGNLIDAVLKLSRLGRRELHFESINVRILLQRLLESLAHQIEQSQVDITYGALPRVMADRTSLEQMLGNILVNAINYLQPGRPGKIRISGKSTPTETVFSIQDNGRGIPEADLPKVFEPFGRAGTPDVPGEGMGLAYVQTLVRRHGGRIWCNSRVGVGTTFSFSIAHNPLKEIQPAEAEIERG